MMQFLRSKMAFIGVNSQ